MTDPEPQPDPAATQLRLHVAIDQLVQPHTEHLDRHPASTAQARAEANDAHRAHIAYLRHQHAVARTRRDHAGMRRAIHAMTLAGHTHRTHRAHLTAHTAAIPSLLDRLHDAVHGTGGSNGAPGAGAHRAPIGLAAAELLATIGRTIGARHATDLADRLRTWQPDDPEQAADHAERWVDDARAIVEPARYTEAKAPCPICGTRRVAVVEDGQRVIKAAIQINLTRGTAVCIAPSCTGRWDRNHFNLLAGMLEQDHDERAARRGTRARG